MKKIAIMQPYFFPYLGYWQLIKAVDEFIIYDDVNFIKKGWINRNNILVQGAPYLFTLPLLKASQNKLINEIFIDIENKNIRKILCTISMAYHNAPFFDKSFQLISEIFLYKQSNLALFLENQLKKICDYLQIKTKFIKSSELNKNNELKAQDKILEICKIREAQHYINPIGGQLLYNAENFTNKHIKLSFIQTKTIQYQQINCNFIPNLSIIDILMFNSPKTVLQLITEYDLI